jgi:glycosyltransferase involved in cell wall biosynthesis
MHVVLHGQLEALVRKDKTSWMTYGPWVRFAMLNIYKGIWPEAYVLGHGIKRRLCMAYPNNYNLRNIIAIEHPYDFSEHFNNQRKQYKAFRVGFLGQARVDKGITDFFTLAEKLSDQVTAGKCEFLILGSLSRIEIQFTKYVSCLCNGGSYLSEQEYKSGLRTLDAAVILYGKNNQLTASGAVFDAIAAGLKIYSLHVPYIEDLKKHDDEDGITLFKNVDDMAKKIIKDIQDGNRVNYRYEKIKAIHDYQTLANKLRVIINDL